MTEFDSVFLCQDEIEVPNGYNLKRIDQKKPPCSPFIIGVCTSYKAIAIVWKSNWKIFGLFLGFLSSIVYVQRFIVVFRHQFVRKNIPALVDQFLLKPIVGKKNIYQIKIPCVIILNVKKKKSRQNRLKFQNFIGYFLNIPKIKKKYKKT